MVVMVVIPLVSVNVEVFNGKGLKGFELLLLVKCLKSNQNIVDDHIAITNPHFKHNAYTLTRLYSELLSNI